MNSILPLSGEGNYLKFNTLDELLNSELIKTYINHYRDHNYKVIPNMVKQFSLYNGYLYIEYNPINGGEYHYKCIGRIKFPELLELPKLIKSEKRLKLEKEALSSF